MATRVAILARWSKWLRRRPLKAESNLESGEADNLTMETKRCTSCKNDLPLDAFNWRNRAKGLKQDVCRECKKIQQRAYYQRNRESYIATSNKAKRARMEKYARRLAAILHESGCVDCGEQDHRCLQFDHIQGEKIKPVSMLLHDGVSWERLKAEVAKCEVRCANCHFKITAERAGWYAWDDSQYRAPLV